MGLTLHAGGVAATREEIDNLPAPEPRGPRHYPVPYSVLLHETEAALAAANIGIRSASYGLARDGGQFFALMALEQTGGIAEHNRFRTALGIRSSTDQSLALSFGIGNHVFVCDNLAFCAEYVMGTKSTLEVLIRLRLLAMEVARATVPVTHSMGEELEGWAEDRLPDWAAERYFVAGLRKGIVTTRQLATWVKEYDEPTAAEHRLLPASKLRLYHAGTAAMRPAAEPPGLNTRVRATLGLREMMKQPIDRIDEWDRPHVRNGIRELVAVDNGAPVWRETMRIMEEGVGG